MGEESLPPTLYEMVGELEPTIINYWETEKWPQLISLGSGKFCLVRVFRTMKETCRHCNHEEIDERFALFTGVEVVRRGVCDKDSDDEEEDHIRQFSIS